MPEESAFFFDFAEKQSPRFARFTESVLRERDDNEGSFLTTGEVCATEERMAAPEKRTRQMISALSHALPQVGTFITFIVMDAQLKECP